MRFLRRAYEQLVGLIHELAKFGTIGAIAFVIDTGGFNLIQYVFHQGPLTSKVAATVIAATVSYLGNRFWTFRHREQSGLAREYFLFFLLNGIGLLIGLLCIGFARYTLELTDPLSINIANLVGVGLGTLFRFWSYKKWVFLAVAEVTEEIPKELPNESTRTL
ncbi:GtrA family protein [Streptosporangium sp. NPDC051023]|uniref:GtrA family protein n=1 Tax=Streptosporangium sp. NPDC051023 TaxID=3155410 RepID=UPI00344EF158